MLMSECRLSLLITPFSLFHFFSCRKGKKYLRKFTLLSKKFKKESIRFNIFTYFCKTKPIA